MNDQTYYGRRAEEQRRIAADSRSEAIRFRHLKLAALLDQRARSVSCDDDH